MQSYSFGVFSAKRSEEAELLAFEWFPLIANYWRPGVVYAVDTPVRPTTPTGFAYKRLGGGTSDAEEPSWPTVLGGTVEDGSGSWECVAAASNGVS